MTNDREKSKKRRLVAFANGTSWLEFELKFNVGPKLKRPVKFEANLIWRSSEAPPTFAALRGSFSSVEAAEQYFGEVVAKEGGTVHELTSDLVGKLSREYGYGV